MMSTLSNLSIHWRAVAGTLRAHAADGAARAYEHAAEELDAAISKSGDEILSPAQAARESGYSEEHIRRLLRQNPGLNAGRLGKPAIRRNDLPRKPTVARNIDSKYDVHADARSLMSRQGEQ